MVDISNHKHSDIPVSPLSPLHETLDNFSSLIPEFQPVVKCPDSTPLLPLITLDLNQTSKFSPNVPNTVVHIPNHSPPNNCFVEEIIHDTTRPNSVKPNFVWASLDNDVDVETISDNSSDYVIRTLK